MDDRDLLALEVRTIFALDDSGRILRRRPPDNGPGPRLRLLSCAAGNVLFLGAKVGDAAASRIEPLAASGTPFLEPGSQPADFATYLQILDGEAPVESHETGLVWTLPDSLSYRHPTPVVRSNTAGGDALLSRLERDGMPDALVTAGFVDTTEFWPPWCVALERDEIASMAFTVGMLPDSAEVGVYTFPAFRGRGYAAAATAGWASHPVLRGRMLFYATSWSNVSSRRVVERLGLRFIGTSLTIT